jgi:hypothetical protein
MANLNGKAIPVHATKVYGEVEIELHSLLTSVVEVSAQFYVLFALPWGNETSMRGRVGPGSVRAI